MQAPRPPVRPGCSSDDDFLRGLLRRQLAADAPAGGPAPASAADFQGPGGMTSLIAAAESGFTNSIEFLLSQGANPHLALSSSGNTALHLAAIYGHVSCVKLLLGAPGALVDVQNNNGDTALLFAANFGHMGVVAALAHAGADLALCNADGNSSFVMASAGHAACLGMLIRLSGDSASTLVRVQGKYGHTALHCAAENSAACVRLLLQAGASALVRNGRGRTPLDVAVADGPPECVTLLEAAAAAELATADAAADAAAAELATAAESSPTELAAAADVSSAGSGARKGRRSKQRRPARAGGGIQAQDLGGDHAPAASREYSLLPRENAALEAQGAAASEPAESSVAGELPSPTSSTAGLDVSSTEPSGNALSAEPSGEAALGAPSPEPSGQDAPGAGWHEVTGQSRRARRRQSTGGGLAGSGRPEKGISRVGSISGGVSGGVSADPSRGTTPARLLQAAAARGTCAVSEKRQPSRETREERMPAAPSGAASVDSAEAAAAPAAESAAESAAEAPASKAGLGMQPKAKARAMDSLSTPGSAPQSAGAVGDGGAGRRHTYSAALNGKLPARNSPAGLRARGTGHPSAVEIAVEAGASAGAPAGIPLCSGLTESPVDRGRSSAAGAADGAGRTSDAKTSPPAAADISGSPEMLPELDWVEEAEAQLAARHPLAAALDVRLPHLAGLGLQDLSASQLEALEGVHVAAIGVIGEARLAAVQQQEWQRRREETRLAAELAAVRLQL